MRIEIIGTESLGVRGLCCKVETQQRRILIDPGVALGYHRYGLLPHPFQVAAGRTIRRRIIAAAKWATDIVISHYHGDHIPLVDANPYQLKASRVTDLREDVRFWTKGLAGLSRNMKTRAKALFYLLNKELQNAEETSQGPMTFSAAVSHGEANNHLGQVMMTKIEDGGEVFVHASDIQLLEKKAILQIRDWHPDIVLASGPPLYLFRPSNKKRNIAWQNALLLSDAVDTLILDHHMNRSDEGIKWSKQLSEKTGKKVLCAADFMKKPHFMLEAWRKQLYRDMPVRRNWHRDYAKGKADIEHYRQWHGYQV